MEQQLSSSWRGRPYHPSRPTQKCYDAQWFPRLYCSGPGLQTFALQVYFHECWFTDAVIPNSSFECSSRWGRLCCPLTCGACAVSGYDDNVQAYSRLIDYMNTYRLPSYYQEVLQQVEIFPSWCGRALATANWAVNNALRVQHCCHLIGWWDPIGGGKLKCNFPDCNDDDQNLMRLASQSSCASAAAFCNVTSSTNTSLTNLVRTLCPLTCNTCRRQCKDAPPTEIALLSQGTQAADTCDELLVWLFQDSSQGCSSMFFRHLCPEYCNLCRKEGCSDILDLDAELHLGGNCSALAAQHGCAYFWDHNFTSRVIAIACPETCGLCSRFSIPDIQEIVFSDKNFDAVEPPLPDPNQFGTSPDFNSFGMQVTCSDDGAQANELGMSFEMLYTDDGFGETFEYQIGSCQSVRRLCFFADAESNLQVRQRPVRLYEVGGLSSDYNGAYENMPDGIVVDERMFIEMAGSLCPVTCGTCPVGCEDNVTRFALIVHTVKYYLDEYPGNLTYQLLTDSVPQGFCMAAMKRNLWLSCRMAWVRVVCAKTCQSCTPTNSTTLAIR